MNMKYIRIFLAGVSTALVLPTLALDTLQNFDSTGTPYTVGDGSSPSEIPPEITAGGPSGNFLRLVHGSPAL